MANKKEAKNDIDLSKINKELDSKKEDILKEVEDKKEEVIKELDSKIESKVEVAVNEKIKTYEKKVVKTKNYKILRRDIVIIILLGLIIYAGYYMYKNDYFNIIINKNNVINTPNDPQEEIKYDSVYYIKNYGYLINNIFINDNELLDIFKKDLITTNDISNSLKLKISYYNIKNKQNDDGNIVFSKEDILSSYQTIFNDTVINNETFTYNNTRFIYYNNMYIGYELPNEELNIKYNIYNSYLKDKDLVFELVVGRVVDNNIINIYDDRVMEYNGNINDYQELLTKYSITFTNNNDKYYFSKIEKIS